jgi:8-oxo-dGTP pyrophosphatase MutT (NUDIX family)
VHHRKLAEPPQIEIVPSPHLTAVEQERVEFKREEIEKSEHWFDGAVLAFSNYLPAENRARLYQTTYAQALAGVALLAVVHVIIHCQKEILFQYRSKEVVYPSHWTSTASGTLTPGQDWLDAAQVELEEEAGIDAQLDCQQIFWGSGIEGALVVFDGQIDKRQVKPSSSEVSRLAWFDYRNPPRPLTHDADLFFNELDFDFINHP